ncbi:HNH endonuclease [Elizabethkingia anophelis]|uniref:HNH endonuclease n=1 Tax=Elizabethkingia anophelis TaxID=1117645 RepID=UPI0021A8E697|nr:HNH endonuclease [Elizabethkingia anophelis]MCT3801741.1 hypothetical protein [Elizabethkingia anophelis]MCT4058950.1 hypothetical protein [Elizabethkingia anophelis]MCT4069559.1 hypothetical protein [Elizabethkingia anophelis]CAH1147642.1 hypothetical protein EAVVTKC53_02439 [Elizabethkingia anophelis]CAI9677154.1 hypothetical protein EAVVTKC53_00228 [Elizabethkingia anophelis]
MEYKTIFGIFFKSGITKTIELFSQTEFQLLVNKNSILSVFERTIFDLHDTPIILTDKIILNINKFISDISEDNPQILELQKYFNQLKKGDILFVIPDIDKFTSEQNLDIYAKVETYFRNDPNFGNKFKFYTQDCNNSYYAETFGMNRIIIGNKKHCRFCNKTINEGAMFKKKSHAISEALGNKRIISIEECDDCNNKFSMSIEPDIVKYFSLHRNYWSIKGKGGVKNIRGNNFSLKKEDIHKLNIIASDKIFSKKGIHNFELDLGYINFQNIYRALCKFFISVVPESYLENFRETIEWINGNKSLKKLPTIAQVETDKCVEHPHIICHIKKDKNLELPYAFCEFYFSSLLLVYIIPITKEDKILEKKFSYEEIFEKFWNSNEAKFFSLFKDWDFKSFNDDFSINYKRNIEIDAESKTITLI